MKINTDFNSIKSGDIVVMHIPGYKCLIKTFSVQALEEFPSLRGDGTLISNFCLQVRPFKCKLPRKWRIDKIFAHWCTNYGGRDYTLLMITNSFKTLENQFSQFLDQEDGTDQGPI